MGKMSMTNGTQTIGKPFLVTRETQAGIQHQIWYEEKGQAVGCGGMSFITKIALPEREALWTIDDAITHCHGKQEG
jgi:hypothetical protein